MVKEEPEVADENSRTELNAEELQDKVKTQGIFKVEDEEQDLKVCELKQALAFLSVFVNTVLRQIHMTRFL